MKGYGAGAWFFAAFEWLRAIGALLTYTGETVSNELSGVSAKIRMDDKKKADAEALRKATFWDRAKADRESLYASNMADIAALSARQEQYRAKLMADARLMAERQERLKKMWETTEPKSTKWNYKV